MSDARDVLLEAANQLDAADALLEHARRATYQAGCRCRPCVQANSAYQAEYRRRLLLGRPILGAVQNGDLVAKRVRALRAEGYRLADLMRLLGVCHMTVIRHYRSQPVTLRTAAKVGRLWQSQAE